MAKSKNNKGKAAGSGTVSNARRERYKKACQERDKFLETSTDLEKAKELQRAHQKKQQGGPQAGSSGAAPSMEMKEKKKEEAAPCQKEQEAAPCQKEQEAAPCQKEQAKQQVDVKVEKKKEEAAPCQKEQKITQEQQLDVKVEKKKEEAAPCQKEQAKKEAEAPAPCQKELGPSTSQVELEKKEKENGNKRTNPPSKKEKKRGKFLWVPQALPAPPVPPALHSKRPKGQNLELKLLVKRKLQQGSGWMMDTGGSPRRRPKKGLPLTTSRPW